MYKNPFILFCCWCCCCCCCCSSQDDGFVHCGFFLLPISPKKKDDFLLLLLLLLHLRSWVHLFLFFLLVTISFVGDQRSLKKLFVCIFSSDGDQRSLRSFACSICISFVCRCSEKFCLLVCFPFLSFWRRWWWSQREVSFALFTSFSFIVSSQRFAQ